MKFALFENDWAYEYDLMKLWERFSMKTSDTNITPAAGFGEPWTYKTEPYSAAEPSWNVDVIRDISGRLIWDSEGEHDFLPEELQRATLCVSALAGIEHPSEFMAEVRGLLLAQDCFYTSYDEFLSKSAISHCPSCGYFLEDGHASHCATTNLMHDIQAMLAKLGAGRSQ